LLEVKKAVETEYNFVLTDTSFYKGFEKSIGKINIYELTNLTKTQNIGYQEEPSLAQDAIPLSFEEYVEYQTRKWDDMCDWIRKCNEFTTNEKSYNFISSPKFDMTLGEEAMEMYGSMTYEEIFTPLNKEHCISNHFCIYDDD
jgi:hypothetical protein